MSDAFARLTSALADRYRIERELGQGGMATVYLAEDLKHHRKVAVKVLRPDLAATLGPERFVREIEVAAQLHHPHILPLYDSGEAGGFLFYVMPYEEGKSLRERLEKESELPIRDVVRLLQDIADALAHAHQHGLVHRDIKPENVMLSGRHALVTDFGVAKAVSDATGRQKLTTIGVALGTPVYMAPEQAAADPHIDHRADIYALGVVGYELLTGRPPFTGPTPQAVLAAQVTQAPVPVEQHRPTVPPALSALIMRCLEKKPADRFQSAAEMVPILEALATPSGGTTPFETAPYKGAAPRSGPRVAYWVGGAVLLGLVAWGGSRLMGPKPLSIELGNIRQVTREAELELRPAISPDGREVAYEAGYAGSTHIVVRDVSGGRPLALTADWAGPQVAAFWMPDGRTIGFTNQRATAEHSTGTWKMPRLGGQAAQLDSTDRLALTGGVTPIFRNDSLFGRRGSGAEWLIRAGLGQAHSYAPRKDGSAVAYVVGNVDYFSYLGNVAPSAIWVTPEGATPVLVTDSTSLNVSPAWLPDGTLLFVSNRDGPRDIYAVRVDRSGAPRERPVRLTTGLEPYTVSVSADGKTVAYERLILRRNIYMVPIARTGSVSIREAKPVTTGNQTIEMLDLSADGKWLVYDSNLEGNQDIFVMPVTGGEPRQVTRDPGDDFSPDFSPDGREIAFHSTRNTTRDIYVIRTDGSGEQRLTSDAAQSYNPAFSPDGLSIAYSNVPSGLHLLRRTAFNAPWQATEPLPVEAGFAPRWSPDGKRLVYMQRGAQQGIGVLTLGGTPRTVLKAGTAGFQFAGWPDWSADGARLYFRGVTQDGAQGVYEVSVAGGIPRLVLRFDDPAMSVFSGSVLSGNGQFYFAVAEIESDIFVMDLVRK